MLQGKAVGVPELQVWAVELEPGVRTGRLALLQQAARRNSITRVADSGREEGVGRAAGQPRAARLAAGWCPAVPVGRQAQALATTLEQGKSPRSQGKWRYPSFVGWTGCIRTGKR